MGKARPSIVHLLLCSYLITVALFYVLVVDSFGAAETVFKLTGFHSAQMVAPAFLALLYLRWRVGHLFSSRIELIFRYVFLILVILVSVLAFWGVVTPPNTVFALTTLNLSQLWLVCLVLVGLLLLNQRSEWWSVHWRRVLSLLPIATFYALIISSFFPFDFFAQLVKEDHQIENLQFLILGLGAGWCGWKAWQIRKDKKKLGWVVFFALCAIGLMLIAGDEVSWGQRVFGFSVNETVIEANRQHELTIHNLYSVEWLVKFGYAGVAVFGLCGKALASVFKKHVVYLKKMTNFSPPHWLFGYFFVPAFFYIAQLIFPQGIWQQWAEVAELFLYSGVVLWLGFL